MKQINMRLSISTLFALLCIPVVTAQIEIHGTITSCEKDSLPGVSTKVKKTKTATISDIYGFYKLVVPDTNAIISYQYVGYISENIRVGNRTTINIVLKQDSSAMDDIKIMVYKPVIYLYPPYEMDATVRFQYSGTVLTTYPAYNNGWSVRALPSGILTNKTDNKEYSYLYWEGDRTHKEDETKYSEGFVVAKDSAVTFLQNILPNIGLKPHEYNEFIVFWLPFLQQNEWNFVYFRVGAAYNIISRNIVSPTPETEIRVFMEFKKVDRPFWVAPQSFSTPPRTGFTLVEWGGSQLKQAISIKETNGHYTIH